MHMHVMNELLYNYYDSHCMICMMIYNIEWLASRCYWRWPCGHVLTNDQREGCVSSGTGAS